MRLIGSTPLIQPNQIYYPDEEYPKIGYNFTIGTLAELTLGPLFAPSGLYHLFGTVCTAYKYNQGRGLVGINGTFNVQGVNTKSEFDQIYYQAMQFLQTNLNSTNATVAAQIATRYPARMGTLVGAVNFDTFLSLSGLYPGFAIPAISYVASTQNSATSISKSMVFDFRSLSTFSISPSTSPTLFTALESFLLQMNWTLVGLLFEDITFGALGVLYEQDSRLKDGISFVCEKFIQFDTGNSSVLTEFVKNYNRCAGNLNRAQVIVFWSSFDVALRVIQEFKDQGLNDYYFVVAYKEAYELDPTGYYADLFKYVFYFQTSVQLPPIEEVNECIKTLATSSSQAEEEVFLALNEFFRAQRRCELYDKNQSVAQCREEKAEDRSELCICAIYDLFAATNESVSLIAKKIRFLFLVSLCVC